MSLFSGIGGFDLGLERAGWECAGQIEIDPFCQRVLGERFNSPRWPDVREWAGNGYESGYLRPDESQGREDIPSAGAGTASKRLTHDAAGRIDLLCGGFPCQDLSVAGKRAGLSGERSGLFWEIIRIAKVIRPAWGFFENVPGLLSSQRGADMSSVLTGLRECWPVVGYRILDSRYFGVAQRRRRVFFVCGPTEEGVASVLFEPEGGSGHQAAGREAGERVARAVACGSVGSGYRFDPNGEELVVSRDAVPKTASGLVTDLRAGNPHPSIVVAPLDTSPYSDREAEESRLVVAQCHGSNVGSMGALRRGSGGLTGGVPFVFEPKASMSQSMNPNRLATAIGTSKEPAVFHAIPIQDARGIREKRQNGMGVGESGDPMFTLDSVSRHAVGVRRLTTLECERLQGFPDGWTCLCLPLEAYQADPDQAATNCKCPDSPRYRALGNAVTVSVIQWLGERLAEVA